MDTTALLAPHRLLEHPFYRRWEAGELGEGELASYAAQYRFFEAQLPKFLEALAGELSGSAAEVVRANLADEVDSAVSHLELFDRFCAAVGADQDAALSPAMAELVATYAGALAEGGADYALGVLAGYELQAAEIAETKDAALGEHYGIDAPGRSFWSLHAEIELDHAEWTLQVLAQLDQDRVAAGAQASASAWWRFLDEAEALAA